MAYKNDGHLVIANRYGSASSDAKSMLYETYDRLRDLTVAGSASSGTGFEAAGGFLYQLASLFAPSAFMTTLGGTTAMNIPGTSYWSQYTGGNGGLTGTYSSFGVNSLGNYSGFPSGYAARLSGYATGGGFFNVGKQQINAIRQRFIKQLTVFGSKFKTCQIK